ncbi:UNVERIFIED_ORG: patatin-like phospholipase family protein [Bacillus sp. AZ43]
MPTRALVLGGGGIAGAAWEVGLLSGWAAHGVDVRDADLVVGTSAGSVVGTLVRTSGDLEALYARQLGPVPPTEPRVVVDATAMMTAFGEAVAGVAGEREARARIGAMALGAATVPEGERRAVIRGRIGDPDWPGRRLLVTAVDTADGEFVAFDASAGVRLLDAVAASCAVPGVWPPITVGRRRFMDGGMRSVTNADLAEGYEVVLVVAPVRGFPESSLGPTLQQEVDHLRQHAEVHVVVADDRALAAFGTNPLDPATREPAARAGRRQAEATLEELRRFWT